MRRLAPALFLVVIACAFAAPPSEAQSQQFPLSKERILEYMESGGTYRYDVCSDTPRTFSELVGFIICYINRIIPLVIGVALLVFFWGIIRYIWSGGEDAKAKGRNLMLWGVIALFVMVSIFGILAILKNSFGI